MSYRILLLVYRKPGTTPEEFKAHYEGIHVPLERALAGEYYPLSHTRRYIDRAPGRADNGETERNAQYPASIIMGTQADFDFDAISELTFEDQAAFQSFFDFMTQPENAAKLAADEELFLDRSKMPIAIVGDYIETKKTDTWARG